MPQLILLADDSAVVAGTRKWRLFLLSFLFSVTHFHFNFFFFLQRALILEAGVGVGVNDKAGY